LKFENLRRETKNEKREKPSQKKEKKAELSIISWDSCQKL
jgi:hypothetical protein